MKNILYSICLILFTPYMLLAATGDTISTSLISDNPGASGSRTIVTGTGCYGDTGTCVKMDCSSGNCSGSDGWTITAGSYSEITIVWYERYDTWPLTSDNCKSLRPMLVSSNYWLNFSSAFSGHGNVHGSGLGTQDPVNPTTILMENLVPTYDNSVCSTSTPYDNTTNPGTPITCTYHIDFAWSTDGGSTVGMGDSWRKMRLWAKLPTAYANNDGEFKLWVDDNLLVTGSDAGTYYDETDPPRFASILFAPVDESATPHGHWYDNITVLEGYVPPEGSDITAPTITGFVIPATSASLIVPISTFTATDDTAVTGYCLVETDSSAGCSWSGSAPTSYQFATQGAKTLYAFARDAGLNVSSSANDSVTITIAQVSPGITSSSIGKGLTGSSIGKSWTVGP